MAIHSLSLFSDFNEELFNLFDEASDAGAADDQIGPAVKRALMAWSSDREESKERHARMSKF